MRLGSKTLMAALIILLAMPRIGFAQRPHVVDQSAIQQALADRATDTAAKRQAIRVALHQPDVVRVAERLGLDIARAETAVATLDGAELGQLAAQAELLNGELAGGRSFTTNAIIILAGLLLVLLIVVAVD